ncbi:hypothetical protein FWH09_00210 [Candidatus Saccharibacteria bacterium]|nr:hypothetical protein [Candidatus Saccharibacteria bacterium]
MQKWLVKNLLIVQTALFLCLGLALSPLTPSALAAGDCDGVATGILAPECDEKGGGIWYILNLVMQILTWGVGVVAVIGVVVASIVYTTAGGDEGKTRLAKTMIFNIAIGVVMYVLLYAIINFIMPGDISGTGTGSQAPGSQTP